ncbi:MAG: AglZ/HisF2 family acetamidino modification protein [Anaerolineales bacterium]|nr:AglZ/HisF2 family acetamidino modification protein [Anaerolineales bacterium]
MLLPRIFPTILLNGIGAVKTVKFDAPTYIGDPINTARIFNANEVDELALLDINATAENRMISLEIVSRISDECFMPLTIGGGVKTIEDIRNAINAGAEKVAINSHAIENPGFVREASNEFGSTTVVVSIDVKKDADGYRVYTRSGKMPTSKDPVAVAVEMQSMGAGELFVNSIDQDGTMAGYDVELIRQITRSVDVPVVACGGAANLEDIRSAIYDGGASAATAGSMFVFQGRKRAVLINFPTRAEIEEALFRE